MDLRSLLPRLLPGVSLPLGIVLVILFFLPWVEMTCAGTPVGEASGWELTVGEMSMSGNMPEQMRAQQDSGDDEGPDGRPWFILGLIVPAILLLVGALGAAGRLPSKTAGTGLVVLGILGIIVAALAFSVDYADEMTKDDEQQPQTQPADAFAQQMGQQMAQQMAQISTETTGTVAVSLVLYVVVALLGVGCLLLPMLLPPAAPDPVAAPGHPPAGPPSSPPPPEA